MKRKLIKFSNYSFCLTLPKFAIERLGWKKGEEVEVEFDEGTEVIKVYKMSKREKRDEQDKREKQVKAAKSNKEEAKKEDAIEPEIQPIPKLRW